MRSFADDVFLPSHLGELIASYVSQYPFCPVGAENFVHSMTRGYCAGGLEDRIGTR